MLSTFAVNMLVFLSIAAGTDYGIFFFGRYQEARQAGEDPERAFYSMYRSVAPVVLASGVTIAGAIFCLSFARLPYFHSMAIPCALGMLVSVAVAVTLVPAGVVHRQSLRPSGPQADSEGAQMARNRNSNRPLACTHIGRLARVGDC